MNKTDLVDRLHLETTVDKKTIHQIVDRTLEQIAGELSHGRPVYLHRFGVFAPALREERSARDPKKPERTIRVPERYVVHFKPSSVLRERLRQVS